MATPPTYSTVYPTPSSWNNVTTPITTSVTDTAGDLLIDFAGTEIGTTTVSTPSGGTGLSYTTLGPVGTTANNAYARCEYATATTSETFTDTHSHSGSGSYGFAVVRYTAHGGVGNTNALSNGTNSAATVSFTTAGDNSDILVFITDWNATAPNLYTFPSVNGQQPTVLSQGGVTGSTYTATVLRYANVGPAGAYTVGINESIR